MLALRSPVNDIKNLGHDLTPAEYHALAVHFALQFMSHTPKLCSKYEEMKRGCAKVFQRPTDEWLGFLTAYAAQFANPEGISCACNCGCKVFSGSAAMCWSCQCMCCAQCLPAFFDEDAKMLPYFDRSGNPRCHICVKAPKFMKDLTPTTPMDGLHWYFNWPEEKKESHSLLFPQLAVTTRSPALWCDPNRPIDLDPQLVEITEVWKTERLENDTRKVLPPFWESAFDVKAVLAGAHGTTLKVSINLFTFMQNPTWRKDRIVKYLQDWVPQNLDYCGPVLNQPARPSAPPPLPPSPRSPATVRLVEELETYHIKSEARKVQVLELTPKDIEEWNSSSTIVEEAGADESLTR